LPVEFQLVDPAGNVGDLYDTVDIANRPGVDSIYPTAPGNLSFVAKTNTSIELLFGATSTEANFDHYIIYYKEGSSGVNSSDSSWDEGDDSNLGSITFSGATSTVITGLATSTDYVFNIYAYDLAGNNTHASEIAVKTNSRPSLAGNMSQTKSNDTAIVNNSWIDDTSIKLTASTTDIDAGDQVSLYFELIGNASIFSTSDVMPSSTCSEGTNYSSCSSKIWKLSAVSANWYNANWPYRKAITIDSDNVLSTENNFVILATSTDSDLVTYARSDAYDIVFTSSDGKTKLDYDREYWNSSTGELTAWIEVDISSTTDTILYMYYGNSSASVDNANPDGVWDSNYKSVYHMNNVPTGTVYDSTTNDNDMASNGSMTSDDLVSGYIGQAIDFDGSDDFLKNSSPSGYGTADNYTMTAWFYNSTQSGWSNFYSHTTGSGDYDPQWAMNGTAISVYDGSSITLGTLAADDTWHRIDIIRVGSTVTSYIDGVLKGSDTHSGTLETPTTIYIAESGDSNSEFWTGKLDEVRYSETNRSLSWIRTEYANQSNVKSFLNFASQKTQLTEYNDTLSVSSLPESASGYKWQVLACDDEGACSAWHKFNNIIPNFMIDLAAPTKPGKLTATTINPTDIRLQFGATTTEANFETYKIYYTIGSTTVSEADTLFGTSSDANLGYIDFNGATSTLISSLTADTEYSFAIWAYDVAGNKASSSVSVFKTTGGGNPPTGVLNSAVQSSDGSGRINISIEVDDVDNDDKLRAKIEYVSGAACDFSTPLDPSLDESSSRITADYGTPLITNTNTYQIGTSSGWILSSPGSNTVNFDWLSATDLPTANGTYCLRLTVNDGLSDQTTLDTVTVTVDNVDPNAPGDLSVDQAFTNSVRLNFGSQGSDTNFSEYRIFYRMGDNGVSPADNQHNDSNLTYVDYNGAASTTVTGLASGVEYVFNIYTYDEAGNNAGATEVTAITNYTPDNSINLKQTRSSGVEVVNGELLDVDTVLLSASSSDVNISETLDFYFELLENSASFASSISEPSSSCSSGTDFESCSSKVWSISDSSGEGPVNWYNQNWVYRKKITIDATKVVANETNFPVLISITDTDIAGKVRSDGLDLVFTDNSGTVLDFEREYLDSANGKVVAWVETDISSTTDTVLYLYYGNGNNSTDLSNASGVWDTNYKGVWHMNNDPSGVIYDSTSNSNNMTSYGSMNSDDLVSGQIGDCVNFDGSNDFIGTTTVSGYGAPSDYTMTAWFFNSSQSGWSNFYSHTTGSGDFDPQFALNGTNVSIYDGSEITGGTLSPDSAWHRVDFIRTGTTLDFYIDASLLGSETHSDSLSVPTELWISNSGDTPTEYWSGRLDEIRYSEISRSKAWIKTEFNNQSNPSSFISLDSEETYTYIFDGQVNVPNISDSNNGYKWQVLACDNSGACSDWSDFNTDPNFKIDTEAPSSPGNLSVDSQTGNTITLNFGSASVENNFVGYKVFYKVGSSGVTELDMVWASTSDANLAYIDYNGATQTTITGLSNGTEYVFNIWAYDYFGRTASATVELVASTNYKPSSSFISASQKTDGSGVVDISVQADDGNDDDLRVKIEYVPGAVCDFSSPLDPNLDETDENATSTYADVKIDNNSSYQIGTSTGWLITSSGANTVNFDWSSVNNEASADDTYCLRTTANDMVDDQSTPDTITLTLDNVDPSAPGNLSLSARTGTSLTLAFGLASIDTNFSHYKIFYKEGVATVSETDTEHVDGDLNYVDYNSTSDTVVSGLSYNTQYSFKIYAYDEYGNESESGQVTFTTNAPPTANFVSAIQKNNASGIVDIAISFYDLNGDDLTARLDYVAGAACDFSSPSDPSLDESVSNISADYGAPGIENDNTYQLGTSTAKIITSSGSNNLSFDWLGQTDLPSADGVYCLRVIANDGTDDQISLATTSVIIDNVAPQVPGDLSINSVTGYSVTLNFGVDSSDSNFKEYKIFYKAGSSGVSETDSVHTRLDDSDLAYIDFNSTATTIINDIAQGTDKCCN